MRLRPPDPESLTPEQRAVRDAIASGPRGGVRGPLALWLHRPEMADRAQALGRWCRYDSALPPRLSELAILTTAAIWRSEYEWHAHRGPALAAGLSEEVIEAIRTGAEPSFPAEDEAATHAFARALHRERAVPRPVYDRAKAALGEAALVDLVAILGYYTLISMTINAFEVALPDGVERAFA